MSLGKHSKHETKKEVFEDGCAAAFHWNPLQSFSVLDVSLLGQVAELGIHCFVVKVCGRRLPRVVSAAIKEVGHPVQIISLPLTPPNPYSKSSKPLPHIRQMALPSCICGRRLLRCSEPCWKAGTGSASSRQDEVVAKAILNICSRQQVSALFLQLCSS